MGFLSSILENPSLLGMAMAGLSRDPEAPMNAVRTYSLMEESQRRRDEMERQEKAKIANMQILNAMQQQQMGNRATLSDAINSFGNIRNMPDSSVEYAPDQQAGTAVDYETGQSYSPAQVPNQDKSQALRDFYAKYAASKQGNAIDFSQYPDADPNMIIAAMRHSQENDPRMSILGMVEKQQEKDENRAWEREKLGIAHGYDMEKEKAKQGNKKENIPNTETEIIYAFEHESDPVKKAVLGKVLENIKREQRYRANLQRPPRDDVFDKKQANARQALISQGVKNPTVEQVAQKQKEMYGGDINPFTQLLTGGSPPKLPAPNPATPKADPLGLRK